MPDREHGWMFDEVRSILLSGTTKKELFDRISVMTADPKTHAIADKLRGYAAKMWNRAEAEERSWTDVSTNDRIDAAFEELTRAGFFAAQNFTCCSSCGHAEAYGSMAESGARGYVFYHQQDTERGVQGEGLMLAYGAQDDADGAVEAIGSEICAALELYGIPYQWNGSGSTRIEIEPFEWRKRSSSKAPPIPMRERGAVLRRGENAGTAAPKLESGATLRHPDGREWSARLDYGALVLTIRDIDGDVHERVIRARDPRAELERRIAELRGDGFS